MRRDVTERAFHHRYLLAWIGLVAVVSLLLWFDPAVAERLLSEEGPIETASALGYLLCGVALLIVRPDWPGKWHAVALLTLMCLRELDFHSRFTSMNITKIKFYLSADVPTMEKLIGASIIAYGIYALYRLVRLQGRPWLAGLRAGRACAFGVLYGLICAIVSKSLDGFARKMRDLEWTLDARAAEYAKVVEETLELGIALMFALSIYCYIRAGGSSMPRVRPD